MGWQVCQIILTHFECSNIFHPKLIIKVDYAVLRKYMPL